MINMDFLTTIKDNSILIIPNNIKEKVLNYIDDNNLLLNIKIMNFNDLKKGLLFDYTNEAINFLMEKYQINYDVAQSYIRDLYYVEEKNYDAEKWQYLRRMKSDLEDNHLLIYDDLFINLLKTKKHIYVYGFDYITKFNKYLLQKVEKYIPIIEIKKANKWHAKEVLGFETMDEEMAFVAESILNLVNQGVDLNNIYIANYDDEYYFSMRRIFTAYHIPYYIKAETTLYKTAMGQFFLDNLTNKRDALLYKIRKHFDTDNNAVNERVYNKISSILNTYYWCPDIKKIKGLIEEEMKVTTVQSDHFDKEVRMVNYLNNVFTDQEYVFLIGFNLGSVPKSKRDEDYLSDNIKPDYLETTLEYNKMMKEATIKALGNIPNLTITYKNISAFNSYYPSFLIDNENFIARMETFAYSHYANSINELLLANNLDNYHKFGEVNPNLEVLNNSYTIPYRTYKNTFTGLNNQTLRNTINDTFVFSYSNISEFYECPFKFFISEILHINIFEETIDQFIGNIFHKCLEKGLDDEAVDIDEIYDDYILQYKSDKPLTNKEHFFIERLREELKFIIKILREQKKHAQPVKTLKETKILIDIMRQDINVKLKGFVDKILVFDNDALVIDYKTGNSQNINLDYLEFGVSLQLPIYLYLLKHSKDYFDFNVLGLYIQHILNFKIEQNANKDYEQSKADTLKLIGVTFADAKRLKNFDDSWESSKIIYDLKADKNGDIKLNNHVLESAKREEILASVEKLIFDCIDQVIAGSFTIAPLKIANKVDGCKYCDYKDICYRTDKDFNFQQVIKKGSENDEYVDA